MALDLIEMILSVLSKDYISNVGFPIAAFTVSFVGLIFLIRDCAKRSIECQKSKDANVTTFFKQSMESQDKHIIAMDNIDKDLKEIAIELKGISVKMDIYMKR